MALFLDRTGFNAMFAALSSKVFPFNAKFMALHFDKTSFNAMLVALRLQTTAFNATSVVLPPWHQTANAMYVASIIPISDNIMMKDNHPQRLDIEGMKPYHTGITLADVLRYRPDDATTHTGSLLVNAVAEILYTTNLLECNDIALYMSVDARALASAIKLELEMSFHDLVQQYRLAQVKQFLAEHPGYKNYKAEELAAAIGYSSSASISRFLKKHLGITPKGRKSVATDRWTQLRSEIRAQRRKR